MSSQPTVDLSDAPVVDAHCHGLREVDLLSHSPEDWINRITLMGMCFASSKSIDRSLADQVSRMAEETLFARLGRRWLAEYLGCSSDEVLEVRHTILKADPRKYLTRMMASENLAGLLVDDGYPLPRVEPGEFEELVGTKVHRVVRIEPLILEARDSTDNVRELEDSFRSLLEEASKDPRSVGFKSIIAYRTGLDVGQPTSDEVAQSYRHWRETGWREGRDTSKAVRDHLLNVTFEIAARDNRPVHIHSGGGDPDIVLPYARPSNLGSLLKRFSGQPVVLIHSGFPWLEEAAYLASIYPMAHLELSVFLPWATLDADRGLSLILGSVPTSKVLYGSDEASEPEILWLSAKVARAALERVLSRAVEHDFLTRDEAQQVGKGILAENVLRLHGLQA